MVNKTRIEIGFLAVLVMVLCAYVPAMPGWAAEKEAKIGDHGDGNRSLPVHVIDLWTEAEEGEQGDVISPDDEPLMPFSPRQTCGECHDYEAISSGWHFNAHDPCVESGLPGQPWILVDPQTATQIPVSYRDWPGAFHPKELGMSNREFIRQFGRHTPGGGVGEASDEDAEPEEIMRGMVTGKLEINCLSCHDGEPAHDQAEYAVQIGRENYRWAAAATCGFASVKGSAKDMPDTWDPFMGDVPDDPKLKPPGVSYDKNRFLEKDKVFVDIHKKVSAQRCYFCHSTTDVSQNDEKHWFSSDEDVHLKAGLTCVDCHKNHLNHAINRGYKDEPLAHGNPSVATLSCEGCHLGDESTGGAAGRLGAPYPTHVGIPTVHFEKLTCTACHSGPWPAKTIHQAKTSRAHRLGTYGVNKSDEALPHIMYPVFTDQHDGKIAPHKLLWPAFWARLNEEKVIPILPETVKKIAGKALPTIKANIKRLRAGNWPDYTSDDIVNVLKLLESQNDLPGRAVYISAGKMHRLDESAGLIVEDHPSAKPYAWSFGHNVRPASQSLGRDGAVGCDHCHNIKAPFFFGEVAVDSPVESERASSLKMVDFQEGVDGVYIWAFNLSFIFRPFMKIVVLLCSAALACFLLLYGLRALGYLTKYISPK